MDWEARQRRREARLRRLDEAWVRGPTDQAYRWFTAAWAAAVLARLSLEEAQQLGWIAPNLLLCVGAVGLVRWGGRLWWGLSALALAVPLLFLGDWLSQTVVMLTVAVAGLLRTRGPGGAGSDADESVNHGLSAAPDTARAVVIATYAVAAFHKLNSGFFDPAVSCAVDTWRQLDGFVEAVSLPPLPGVELAAFAVAFEVAVAAGLWWRPRLGILLGLTFHLPLTLVLAPAFVFVMVPGYVASLSAADRAALGVAARRHGVRVVALAVAGTVALAVVDGALPIWDMALKEAALLGALALLVHTPGLARSRRPPAPVAGVRRVRTALLALFVVNAATPYLGLQFQHTAAMLSNLRIDRGCWNHLLVPETVRLRDPYVRIDEASVGGQVGPPFEETEALLREGLWSYAALRRMRRNWCREETRPIALRGTWDGADFALADLCDEGESLPGRLLPFGDYLSLQKGLRRECPQACLH